MDLDIKNFRVTSRVSLEKAKPIKIVLMVFNLGILDEGRPAEVVGHDGTRVVYSETIIVSDDVGGGLTKWEFPTYIPTAVGDIMWTVEIFDDDLDDDIGVDLTEVVP